MRRNQNRGTAASLMSRAAAVEYSRYAAVIWSSFSEARALTLLLLCGVSTSGDGCVVLALENPVDLIRICLDRPRIVHQHNISSDRVTRTTGGRLPDPDRNSVVVKVEIAIHRQ